MPGGIHPPLSVIAKWPAPNYVDPITQPKSVLIVCCVLGPLTTFLLLARLHVRLRMQHNAGWDDVLMFVALFPILALSVILPLITEACQFNRHIWDVNPRYFPIQRRFIFAIYPLYTVATGLIKMSILLFYRRLTSRAVSPTVRWLIRIVWVAVLLHTIAFSVVPFLLCKPMSAFWNQSDVVLRQQGYKYKCLNEDADVVASTISSTALDFVVALIPTVLCWNLQMAFRQKIALYGVFALSYVTVGVAVVRAMATWEIFFETYDVTWVAASNWLWTAIELYVGTICANAPALKVFFAGFINSETLLSWRTRKNSMTNPNVQIVHPKRSRDEKKSGGSGLSTWDKYSFWTKSDKTQLSTSNHGMVLPIQANGDVLQTHAQEHAQEHRDSMSQPLAPEYLDSIVTDSHPSSMNSRQQSYEQDIEMGVYPNPRPAEGSSVEVLPVLTPPESVRWGQRMRSSSPFSRREGGSWDTKVGQYVLRPWDKDVKEIEPMARHD